MPVGFILGTISYLVSPGLPRLEIEHTDMYASMWIHRYMVGDYLHVWNFKSGTIFNSSPPSPRIDISGFIYHCIHFGHHHHFHHHHHHQSVDCVT